MRKSTARTKALRILKVVLERGYTQRISRNDLETVMATEGMVDERTHARWIRLLIGYGWLRPHRVLGKPTGLLLDVCPPADVAIEAFEVEVEVEP